jgi:hypothetical protein
MVLLADALELSIELSNNASSSFPSTSSRNTKPGLCGDEYSGRADSPTVNDKDEGRQNGGAPDEEQ